MVALHALDLDTFFVSVDRLFEPSLRGVAVVVGGRKWGRGMVTSASYEAAPSASANARRVCRSV